MEVNIHAGISYNGNPKYTHSSKFPWIVHYPDNQRDQISSLPSSLTGAQLMELFKGRKWRILKHKSCDQWGFLEGILRWGKCENSLCLCVGYLEKTYLIYTWCYETGKEEQSVSR